MAHSQTRESTKDNENMKMKLSVSVVNTLQTEHCASTSFGVRGTKIASTIVAISLLNLLTLAIKNAPTDFAYFATKHFLIFLWPQLNLKTA